VEKYDTEGQAKYDNKTRRLGFECWINKATHRFVRARGRALTHACTHVYTHKHTHT